MRTRQTWHAAVRHTGLLFQLPNSPSLSAHTPPAAARPSRSDPPRRAGSSGGEAPGPSHEGSEEEDGAACLEAAAELPYPQLAQTVSSASFAPAAHLAEHYSPPGGAHALCLCIVLPYVHHQPAVHGGLRVEGKQGCPSSHGTELWLERDWLRFGCRSSCVIASLSLKLHFLPAASSFGHVGMVLHCIWLPWCREVLLL